MKALWAEWTYKEISEWTWNSEWNMLRLLDATETHNAIYASFWMPLKPRLQYTQPSGRQWNTKCNVLRLLDDTETHNALYTGFWLTLKHTVQYTKSSGWHWNTEYNIRRLLDDTETQRLQESVCYMILKLRVLRLSIHIVLNLPSFNDLYSPYLNNPKSIKTL